MVYIYALKLENNKYYIGKTNNPSFRIENHFNSEGSAWTKKYKPIELIELIPDCDNYDEDKYTIKYMEKYGITNVRGGSFCEIRLNENNISILKKMITSCSNKCFICGLSGHYAKECKKKENTKIPTVNLHENCDCPTSYFSPHRKKNCLLNNILSYFDDESDDIDKIIKQLVIDLNPKPKSEKQTCFKCGRIGHYANKCYAKTHINGESLYDDSDTEYEEIWCCGYCDKEFSTNSSCLNHQLLCKQNINKKNNCYRCGRSGHYANECYAKTNKYGYNLDDDVDDDNGDDDNGDDDDGDDDDGDDDDGDDYNDYDD